MNQNEFIEKSAEIICSYFSRLNTDEIIYQVKKLKGGDLGILFRSALRSEKYKVCIALQKASARMLIDQED